MYISHKIHFVQLNVQVAEKKLNIFHVIEILLGTCSSKKIPRLRINGKKGNRKNV